MTSDRRPLLVIVYGTGATSPFLLTDSASPMCDIAWVVDSDEFDDRAMLRLLRKLGQVVDIAGMTEGDAADALRALQPDGIVAYADARWPRRRRWPGGSGSTITTPSWRSGCSTRSRSVRPCTTGACPCRPAPPCRAAPPPERSTPWCRASNSRWWSSPRQGAASRDTHLVRGESGLRRIIGEESTDDAESTMVVESYMVGATPPPSEQFSDYVSVESVVVAGRISHLAVTGRLPQDAPFRETGLIIPSDFAPSLQEEILDLATAAIEAIGIRIGCLHTEIKVTDKGPRVIEVNGRIGGFVPQTLQLASPTTDLFEISRRVALGEQVVFPDLVPTTDVGYVIAQQPPIGAHQVASVHGLDRLAAYPGVDAVSLSRQPGDEVDWRKGSHEYVFSVLGTVPRHEDMRALEQFIDEAVTVTYI